MVYKYCQTFSRNMHSFELQKVVNNYYYYYYYVYIDNCACDF